MVEYIPGIYGERDLIDELSRHQIIQDRFNAQVSSRSRLNLEPMTAAALRVRLAAGSSRSIRAAMVACTVAAC